MKKVGKTALIVGGVIGGAAVIGAAVMAILYKTKYQAELEFMAD